MNAAIQEQYTPLKVKLNDISSIHNTYTDTKPPITELLNQTNITCSNQQKTNPNGTIRLIKPDLYTAFNSQNNAFTISSQQQQGYLNAAESSRLCQLPIEQFHSGIQKQEYASESSPLSRIPNSIALFSHPYQNQFDLKHIQTLQQLQNQQSDSQKDQQQLDSMRGVKKLEKPLNNPDNDIISQIQDYINMSAQKQSFISNISENQQNFTKYTSVRQISEQKKVSSEQIRFQMNDNSSSKHNQQIHKNPKETIPLSTPTSFPPMFENKRNEQTIQPEKIKVKNLLDCELKSTEFINKMTHIFGKQSKQETSALPILPMDKNMNSKPVKDTYINQLLNKYKFNNYASNITEQQDSSLTNGTNAQVHNTYTPIKEQDTLGNVAESFVSHSIQKVPTLQVRPNHLSHLVYRQNNDKHYNSSSNKIENQNISYNTGQKQLANLLKKHETRTPFTNSQLSPTKNPLITSNTSQKLVSKTPLQFNSGILNKPPGRLQIIDPLLNKSVEDISLKKNIQNQNPLSNIISNYNLKNDKQMVTRTRGITTYNNNISLNQQQQQKQQPQQPQQPQQHPFQSRQNQMQMQQIQPLQIQFKKTPVNQGYKEKIWHKILQDRQNKQINPITKQANKDLQTFVLPTSSENSQKSCQQEENVFQGRKRCVTHNPQQLFVSQNDRFKINDVISFNTNDSQQPSHLRNVSPVFTSSYNTNSFKQCSNQKIDNIYEQTKDNVSDQSNNRNLNLALRLSFGGDSSFDIYHPTSPIRV